jgi:hypothetical protein
MYIICSVVIYVYVVDLWWGGRGGTAALNILYPIHLSTIAATRRLFFL